MNILLMRKKNDFPVHVNVMALPRVGDYVAVWSRDGTGANHDIMRVLAVVHYAGDCSGDPSLPMVIVETTHNSVSLRDFYQALL